MNGVRYRGVRFLPAAGDPGEPGLRLDGAGYLEMVEDDAAVRQAILLLIATRPGERVMRPAYGCDLQQLVFSPNDDTTAGLAVHYVRRAVERWEPRVQIVALDAVPDGSNELKITLEYRFRATQRRDQVVVRFSLGGPA